MNERLSPVVLLRNAARLIQTALIQLDTREAPACAGCGRRRFVDRTHAYVYRALTNVPEKLRQSAAKLDGGVDELGRPAASTPEYIE